MTDELTHSSMSVRLSITKEELAHLPAAQYTAAAEIIDCTDDILRAVNCLREAPIIGFDTETRPSFRKGVSHSVSLLQLATSSSCYLFRIHKTGLTQELISLLEDKKQLKVGVSLRDDFHQLNKAGLKHPDGFIELQNYVKKFGIADNSLSRIYAILFNHRIAKAQRLSNWEAPSLTEAQVKYAALDAKACLDIYEHLSEGLFDPLACQYKEEPKPILP